MDIWERLAAIPTGRWSKWLVVVIWLVVVVALAPLSGRLTGVEQNSQSSFVPSRAASTLVADYESHFPRLDGLPALVVLHRSTGLTARDLHAVAQVKAKLGTLNLPGVTTIGHVELAKSGTGLLLPITLAPGTSAVSVASDVEKIEKSLTNLPKGVQAGVGGPAATLADTANSFNGIDGTLLLATIAIVTVLLLLTYRSVVMWVLPLLGVGLASVIGEAAVYLLARSGFVVNGMTIGILTVLMFGAGTDYSLLLIARYREELRVQESVAAAMRTALAKVAPTLATSAATVILSLLVLLVAQENDIRALGPVGAVGIAAVLISGLTLLPAILVIIGRPAFWPLVPMVGTAPTAHRLSWSAVSRGVGRHSGVILGGALVLLVGLAVGTIAYPGSLPQSDSFTGHVGSVAAQRLIDESFPAGLSGPAVIALRDAAKAPVAASIAARTPGIGAVGPTATSGEIAIFQATLTSSPTGSRAEMVVRDLRSREQRQLGSAVLVGGVTATQIDLDQAAARDRTVVIPIVLLIVFLMLAILLQALLAPLILMASVVLSFLASLGVAILAYRYLFHFPGVDSSVILLGFVFLVALGIDYNVFLSARARQEAASSPTSSGMLRALAATGGSSHQRASSSPEPSRSSGSCPWWRSPNSVSWSLSESCWTPCSYDRWSFPRSW